MKRKVRVWLLLFVLGVFVVERTAEAYAPVVLAPAIASLVGEVAGSAVGGAGVMSIGAGGVLMLGGAVVGAAALVGAAIYYYDLGDSVHVPVAGAPNTSGSAMPSTYTGTIYCAGTPCNGTNPYRSASPGGACTTFAASSNGSTCTVSEGVGTFNGVAHWNGGGCTYDLVCMLPDGAHPYLSNQAQGIAQGSMVVPIGTSDNKVSLKKDTAGWVVDSTDPDTGFGTASLSSPGEPLRVVGRDSAGHPVAVSVTPGAGNSVRLDYTYQDPLVTGVPVGVHGYTIVTNSNGVVTEVTSGTYPGYQIDPVTGDISPITVPTTTGTAPVATGSQPIQFPNDFPDAATHTLLTSTNTKLDSVKDKLDTMHHDLSDVDKTPPADPTARTSDEISGVFYAGTFSSLLSWTLPARSVSCPTWTVSVWGENYLINGHCTLLAGVVPTIAALMLLVWSGLALFIVLSA